MSVVELIDAVKELSESEKGEFLDRLMEIDFEDAWDRQIEADAKAGRLDHLWRRLGHERVPLRGRLARHVVLADEHLRLVLDLALLVHADPFPFPYTADTVRQHSGRKVVLMRLLVAVSGLVALIVLILPVH